MDHEQIIRSLRLQLLIERIAFGVIMLVVTGVWATGHFGDGKSLILVDGRPVACVTSKQDAEGVLSEIKSKTGCDPEEVKFQQEVRVARAPHDASPVSRTKAFRAVRDAVCPMISRWAVIANGKPLCALPDEKTAGETIELAKTRFGSKVNNLAEEPQFKENVKVDIAAVPLELYCSNAQQAIDLIFNHKPSVTEDAVYTVSKGDLAVSIARRHDLKLAELEELNPGMNLAKLQIGDQIHVKAAKDTGATLTVVVRDQSERVETVPAPVQKVSSAQIYVGQSCLLAPGRDGQRRVKVATIYENGRKVGSEELGEEILIEPSPRRVAIGIKQHRP